MSKHNATSATPSDPTPSEQGSATPTAAAPTGTLLIDYRGQVSAATRRPHIGFRVVPAQDGSPGREFVLRPGVQPIAAARWAELDKSVREFLIASGQLVVLPEGFSIGDVTPADALGLVERTTVPEVLREWQRVIAAMQGDLWGPARDRIAQQITAVTTDVHGNPATQREIVLPATVHGRG